MICPYCGGEIPSKDFALRTPGGRYFHFPCADKALDAWARNQEKVAIEWDELAKANSPVIIIGKE